MEFELTIMIEQQKLRATKTNKKVFEKLLTVAFNYVKLNKLSETQTIRSLKIKQKKLSKPAILFMF